MDSLSIENSKKQSVCEIKVSTRGLARTFIVMFTVLFLLLLHYFHIDIDWLLSFVSLVSVTHLAYHYPNFVIRYVMVFFMATGNLVGVLICEHSHLWLTELAVYAKWAGSFPLLLLGWGLFIYVLWYLDTKHPLHCTKSLPLAKLSIGTFHISMSSIVIIALSFLSLLLLLHVIGHPFFAEHMDRFRYRELFVTGLWKRFGGWISIGIPILLLPIMNRMIFGHKAPITVAATFSLFCYGGYLFLSGEKFGGFWYIIVDICVVFSIIGQSMDTHRLRNILTRTMGIFMILMMVVLVNMSLLSKNSSGLKWNLITNYFPQRIAQQGQLWWKTYDLDRNGPIRLAGLKDETNVFFEPDDSSEKKYNHAIYKIMRFTTPADIFQRKIESGSRYSTSTFASMFYYFKETGVIIWALLGGTFFYLVTRMFLYAVSHLYILEIALAMKFLAASYGALAMSEFNLLFQTKQLIYFLLFLGLIVLREYLHKKRMRCYEARK